MGLVPENNGQPPPTISITEPTAEENIEPRFSSSSSSPPLHSRLLPDQSNEFTNSGSSHTMVSCSNSKPSKNTNSNQNRLGSVADKKASFLQHLTNSHRHSEERGNSFDPTSTSTSWWKPKSNSNRSIQRQHTGFQLWLAYCHLITLGLPNRLLEKLGYNSSITRERFREKVSLTFNYILLNLVFAIFVGWILFDGCVVNQSINPITIEELVDLPQPLALIHSKLYSPEDIGLIPSKPPFMNQSRDDADDDVDEDADPLDWIVFDGSFLVQPERTGLCDEFWGAVGPGTYFPCLPINLLNATTFPRPLGQPNHANLCTWSAAQRSSLEKLIPAYQLHWTWESIREFNLYHANQMVKVYRDHVVDFNRLRYLHPRLLSNQPKWFTELLSLMVAQPSIDINFLIHNQLSKDQIEQFDQCIIKFIDVGELSLLPFMCWFPSTFLMIVFTVPVVWLLFGSLGIFMTRLRQGYPAITHKLVPRPKLPISRSYFRLKFLKSQSNLNNSESSILNDSRFGLEFEEEDIQSKMAKRDFDQLLLDRECFPSTIQFDPADLNRGVHHLAQTEPNYKLTDDLDFEPMRSVIVIPSSGRLPNYSKLVSTIKAAAETRYPATHKLVIVVLDGVSNPDELPKELGDLLHEEVVPRYAVKGSAYQAQSDIDIYAHNVAKAYAGYYQYKNLDYSTNPNSNTNSVCSSLRYSNFIKPSQSKMLQVPLIIISKHGNPDEAKDYCQGMRGMRDNLQLVINFFHRIFFNAPLCPLDFDLVTLIKAVSGVSPEHFSLLLTLAPGAKLTNRSLIDLVRPLAMDNRVSCVVSPLCYRTSNQFSRSTKVLLSWVHNWVNPLAFMTDSRACFLPRSCTIYRLWAPPSHIQNQHSYLENNCHHNQPILLHPSIVSQYVANPHSLLTSLFFEWGEDEYLSHLIQLHLPNYHLKLLKEAVCSLPLPNAISNWLKFNSILFLKLITTHFTQITSTHIKLMIKWPLLIMELGLLLGPSFQVITIMTIVVSQFDDADPGYLFAKFISSVIMFSIMFIYFAVVFLGAFMQQRTEIKHKFQDFIFSIILFIPLTWLVPIISLWNSDGIANKNHYSSAAPNYQLARRFNNTNQNNTSTPPASASYYPKSPLSSANQFNGAQSGYFDKDDLASLDKNTLFDGSGLGWGSWVPFRYYPDWLAMISHFKLPSHLSYNNNYLRPPATLLEQHRARMPHHTMSCHKRTTIQPLAAGDGTEFGEQRQTSFHKKPRAAPPNGPYNHPNHQLNHNQVQQPRGHSITSLFYLDQASSRQMSTMTNSTVFSP